MYQLINSNCDILLESENMSEILEKWDFYSSKGSFGFMSIADKERGEFLSIEECKSIAQEYTTFDDLITLGHYVTIFVPSTQNVNKTNDVLSNEVLDYVTSSLIDLYGGMTKESVCQGGWNSEVYGHVLENVTPVTVYLSELTREAQIEIMDLVKYIKRTMKQESIFMIVDGIGKLFF